MQAKSFKTTLSILHLFLLAGLSVFLVFAYFQNQSFKVDMNTSDVFIYIVPIAAAIGYFTSKYIFQKLLTNVKMEDVLEDKLKKYYIASIIKYACIEGPSIFALAAYLLSGTILHLVIALTLMVYLYTQRPRIDIILREIPMNSEEKKEFDTSRL